MGQPLGILIIIGVLINVSNSALYVHNLQLLREYS